jgi:hypothetical protein
MNITWRIGFRDSSKNSVLASGDETLGRYPRKFFYCQNSRLRVRAARFRARRVSRGDVVRALRIENVNQRNSCGTGISCNIDKCRCRSLLHFLHHRANALSRLRSSRVARVDVAASTLP